MNISEPAPARKSWPRRHKILTALGVIAALITIGGVAGALAGNGSTGHPVQAATSQSPAAAAVTQSPAPSPSPGGKYQGSCDYTLTSSLNGYDHLIGEIDLTNTGNTGVIVKTRITWPQEGAAPVTARKTVRLPFGASKPVRFSIPVSNTGNVIDLLQSWQDRHGLRDGCTYHAAFTSTFGAVHG